MDSHQTDQILDLMGIMVSSYPSQAAQDSSAAVRGYFMAIDGCSFRAVDQVLRRIISGRQPGFDNKFAPSSGSLGEWCREADRLITLAAAPPKVREHGVMKLNFGGRDIYTADMPLAEVEELIRTNGKSFAGQGQLGAASSAAIHRLSQRFTTGDPDAEGDMGDQRAAS